MLYFPLLDLAFASYAPIMERNLVEAGQAVLDPPHRGGGYRLVDGTPEGARLERLLYHRACDMERRRQTQY